MKQPNGQYESFADVLGLIEPLTTTSFPGPAVEIAMRRAQNLPAIPCGGFEFSLLHDDGVVDLMQSHAMDERGAARLIAYLDRSCDLARQPWQWLRELVAQDCGGIVNIWLEFDAKAGPDAPPSVFLEFDHRAHLPPARLYELLDRMPLANAQSQKVVLERIVAALPESASISHLGAMFSRSDTPLRVNVKRLKSRELASFSAQIGLQMCVKEPAFLMERAYRATVCLDIIEDLLPRIGVEYSFTRWPVSDVSWKELSQIASNGNVLEGNWGIFQGWARVFTPIETPGYWPACCILDEISYPLDVWSIIECGPSHVKATYASGQPMTLKAYLGFRPSLLQQDGTVLCCDEPINAPSPRATSIGEGIARGIDFLMEERTQDGLWRDFATDCQSSDEWVSGYIGAHLLELDHPAVRAAAQSAWEILRERRGAGKGWGYHRQVQPDADSTAWVLILAQRLGCDDDPVVRANRDFLRVHLDENGAAVTYSKQYLEQTDQPFPRTEAHAQWHGQHDDVTASSALAGLDEALENLIQTQSPDGSWKAFWFESDAYSTGLACEALVRSSKPSAEQAAAKAARWALDHLSNKDTRAFDLAWLIRAAWCVPANRSDPRLADAVQMLAGRQQADGGWVGDCVLIVPIMDASQSTVRVYEAPDIHRNFTTATALVALEKARKRGVEWQKQ